MKLVFYSVILNHHQACVADEFYQLLGDDYTFVEMQPIADRKGSTEDYSKRPYLLCAWESEEKRQEAFSLARTSDVCVFSGVDALPFERERLKLNLLSFDMDERPLKRGLINVISPANLKTLFYYWFNGWHKKPLYKLCCSAFTKDDYYRLRMFKNKCYRWGYFTRVDEDFDVEASTDDPISEDTHLMWCSRFLVWKHPEMPVLMAKTLKDKGYKFLLSMYGDEGNAAKHDEVYPRKKLENLIMNLGVSDCVRLMGNCPNNEILDAMKQSSIFLFTSDRLEGWGAVANESMANGCALIASDAIGSSPYLIENGVNGYMFKSCDVESLCKVVQLLLEDKQKLKEIQENAYNSLRTYWSPQNAAKSLLSLISSIKSGRMEAPSKGPCSLA